MRTRTIARRLTAGLLGAAVLLCYPVLPLGWAKHEPVPSSVATTPIAGVDPAALATAPPAYDPQAVRGDQDTDATGPRGALPRAQGSTSPVVLTGEMSRDRFTVAGVSWTSRASTAPVVQVRLREPTGWTDWEPLDAGHGPDERSLEAHRAGTRAATQPIFSASADAVQVRVDTPDAASPEGLAVKTVDGGTSPADKFLTGVPGASARAAVTRPGIITRAQWGADESLRDCTPTYSPTIKVGFVHHTTGSNAYAPSDSAAIVRGIYAYHVNGNGWCDVGYNFFVDRHGQIFEGRAGGIDKPVIGAHTGGFNSDSFAVSAMGTFTSTAPPAPLLTSISAVLGWKMGMHGRTIGGTDVLVSAGGSATRHPAGTPVSLNVVSGHRDPGLTECPGAALYAQLPNLRALATNYRNANYRPDFQTAFQANTGTLWTTGTVGTEDKRLGMMARTSPSLALVDGGTGYQIAFQANSGRLWATGALGTRDTGLGMMPGTSPSLALVNGGTGYQMAFQANSGRLWTTGALGTRDTGFGMMPGTSPTLTAVGGGYQIAFQANSGRLWTTGTLGTQDRQLGMAGGTSPTITAVAGGYQIAFQANTTSLWTTGTGETRNFGLGMAGGTSPSITAVANGYQVAFQANTSSLWTTGSQGTEDRRLGMAGGTSPSITAVDGGYQMAFQANTTSLWNTGSLGTLDTRLGMMPRTGPDA